MQDSTGPGPKQLLSERIKKATNILVTVSRDPSVDELSAALALTVMLNKMDKHATAVFSGKTPPAINFLHPDKTFEGTVDSLRDFIIALDKEKADRLRYKVEDDVVRIFITPYRTVINEHDLAFSQGDFNVELIIALGVEKKEDLDTAISAHGRILHDAAVATVNTSNRDSSLGTIDWTDPAASSYSEMLMGLSESLKPGILDEQIATALLTGIVAATERFSNKRTTPKVMTMSAQLMAAGANQQLIATKLEEGQALPAPAQDGSKHLQEGSSAKVIKTDKGNTKAAEPAATLPTPDGEMHVDHDTAPLPQSIPNPASIPEPTTAITTDPLDTAEAELEQVMQGSALPVATVSVDDLKDDLAAAGRELDAVNTAPAAKLSISSNTSDWRAVPASADEPLFGGTLNATTDEARAAREREDKANRNRTILDHTDSNTAQPPLNSVSPGYVSDTPTSVDPFAGPPRSEPDAPMSYEPTDIHGRTLQPLPALPEIAPEPPLAPTAPTQAAAPTLAELEAQTRTAATVSPINDARAAVNAALESLPFSPANEPLAAVGAQPLSGPSLHGDASSSATYVPAPGVEGPVQAITVPVANANLAPLPPLPDFSTLPPLPAELDAVPTTLDTTAPQLGVAPSLAQPSNDPGQFKLPGQ